MREELRGLVLILWLSLFGYAVMYTMILGGEHRPFAILDSVAHGLVVFSDAKPIAVFLFGLLGS